MSRPRPQSVDTLAAERIAALEARQDGRRAHIAEIEAVIAEKQREIDNLRAQLPIKLQPVND